MMGINIAKPLIRKTVTGQTALKICGGDSASKFARVLGKRKKFDLAFHHWLEKYFLD